MRTEQEIREKIDRYMNKLSYHLEHSFVIGGDKETVAEYNGIMDALRWVIGESSL